MRYRFGNIPILIALTGVAVLSLLIFASHRQAILSSSVPSLISVNAFKPQAAPMMAGSAASESLGQPVGRVTLAADRASGPEPRLLPPPPRGSRAPSQLIRSATISLEVSDVANALRAATAVTDAQLGDVIGLNDQSPATENAVHTATMQVRVPQYRFEQTLNALGRLGKVKASSVNAQDVSDQLVDTQARLRNMRRTEADILKILDRSGNIEQVLSVTQQLSGVREQIERLDAQLKGMQYQVDYSTISIDFSSPVVVITPSGFGLLSEAWKSALASLEGLTVSLLGAGLWLIAFSPYIALVALLAVLLVRSVRRHRVPAN